MAAKQGITAHVYQASEDARRAVLSRAPSSVRGHSWLSNLNTTCTIKSAPPRTPEVMSMLAIKSGWLIKRNEQHVWQRRFCCVVPHTFLYYFDAEPIEAAAAAAAAAGVEYPIVVPADNYNAHSDHHHDNAPGSAHKAGLLSPSGNNPSSTYSNVQPVGIIDLECYNTVDRGSMDDLVLELTGDSVTNPDLRSFFFQGDTPEDCEHWTKAFVSDRHSALKDESEAYRQVCESFPLQLMHCSRMVDDAEEKQQIAERKAYNVRSAAEESRKRVVQIVLDALERKKGEDNVNEWFKAQDGGHDLNERRRRYIHKLDKLTSGAEAVSMNAGVCESVEILAQYTEILRIERAHFGKDLRDMKGRVKDLGHSMISKKEMEHKQKQLDRVTQAHQLERSRMADRISTLEALLKKEKQEREDAERTLDAKNMEFTMLSAASKQKIQELSAHKKILKREVIELRSQLEDISSDATVFKHKTEGLDLQVKAERERYSVLERHLEHVTGQIKMQERLMDSMMSQAGSIYGGDSRVGDMYSVGGNSSFHGDGGRTGYPPIRPTGSRVSAYGGDRSVVGNSNDIPRYPGASPRQVPPEITSKPPIAEQHKRPSTSVNDPNSSSTLENKDRQTFYDDRVSPETCRSDSPQNEKDDDNNDSNSSYDDVDDDNESRGNLSELTEDRTFRAEAVTVVDRLTPSDSKHRDISSPPNMNKTDVNSNNNSNNNNNINNINNNMKPMIQLKVTNELRHPESSHLQRVVETNSSHLPPVAVVGESSHNTGKMPTPIKQRPRGPTHDFREVQRPPRTTNVTPLRERGGANSGHQKIIHNIPHNQHMSTNNHSHYNNHLHPDTISISMSSLHSGGASVVSYGGASVTSGRMSVAQRARLDADRGTQARIVKPPPEIETQLSIASSSETESGPTGATNQISPSGGSIGGGSVWSRLSNALVDKIDNSVLAVKVPGEVGYNNNSPSHKESESVTGRNGSQPESSAHPRQEEKKTAPKPAPAKPLTLAQRQKLQREKQLAFLKHQGLLKERAQQQC